MNLGQLFQFSVYRYPDNIAIVQGDRRVTFAELNQEVNRVASSLQRLGLKKQDRVLVLLKNRIETIVLFWAIQKIGAVFTPINLRLSPEDIHYCINDVEAKFVIFEESSAHTVMQGELSSRPIYIGLNVDNVDVSYTELLNHGSETFYSTLIDDDDISVILYTSGTTGRPKGVPRSHKNEYASTLAHIFQCYYEWHECTLGVMPIYHTMGLRSLIAMVLCNGTFVSMPDFDAHECLNTMVEEKVSCLYLTPTMYHDLVHHPEVKYMTFPSLRTLVYAGAPMSKALIQKCTEIFAPQHFINHYGSTEIYTFTTCSEVTKKPGCAGKPGIHQHIRLVVPDPERKASPLETVKKGEIGEIIVDMSSSEAFKGYWNRPDATASSIKDGWYFTGDLGYVDDEGDLYIVGRIDEMILYGGENIHPQEVERVIQDHPKVEDVVVVGEKDERWGQIVVAYVVPKDDTVSVQELDQYCKQHKQLSNYIRPRKYIFLAELPRTTAGKIAYRKLRDGQYSEYIF
ncbi:2-furoate---CoA ligase [Caldalkalibacillus uzonensis]|uniref:2-furoate---CoA ligase n=1 Tax=Caldalkalibacillus uzonensis TaxID=353224 RepID=A0ABU0CXZ5_9BACI|nr:class I adenylate-forming enzyme family protein [Caldalkalibacillus uzonensis]MDQ0341004.1 2-furoate---CoA ligase [Caldalkalibacillus uzonensis]